MITGVDRSRLQHTQLSGRSVRVNMYGAGCYDGWYGFGYAEKRERKVVKGSRPDLTPVGLTCGEYTPGAMTVKFLAATAQLIREGLAAKSASGKSYGDVSFGMTVSMTEPDTVNAPVLLYSYATCAIVEDKGDVANTAEEVIEEFGITYVRSNKNGLYLFSGNTS